MPALLDGKVVVILSPPDFRRKLGLDIDDLTDLIIDSILTDQNAHVLVDNNGNVLNQ